MKAPSPFEIFFKENYNRFFYYAYQLTDDEEASRDIVSDSFEYVWKKFQSKDICNWKAYMYSYIHNKCIDFIRHRIIEEKYATLYIETTSEADVVEDDSDTEERIEQIKNVLRTLPTRTQFVVQECFVQNKKYKEVAEELEISVNAIKQHIVKALKIIRKSTKIECEINDQYSH